MIHIGQCSDEKWRAIRGLRIIAEADTLPEIVAAAEKRKVRGEQMRRNSNTVQAVFQPVRAVLGALTSVVTRGPIRGLLEELLALTVPELEKRVAGIDDDGLLSKLEKRAKRQRVRKAVRARRRALREAGREVEG